MLFSEKWLREFVNPDISREQLIEQLTMAGLEIEGFEAAANTFDKVVVGVVESVEKHPDADKLSVCQVRVSSDNELLQIVCGASNVRAGLKVPVALVGAKLSKDFKIKKSKLRGVESNGMLCAEEELGLAESSDGLLELPQDAQVGVDIRDYLLLDDAIIEVDLTPNRGDCLSIQGLARDVAALNNMDVNLEALVAANVDCDEKLSIELEAEDACPRYIGRVIRNIDIKTDSPIWLKEKLRRGGIRSIDAVVDVTNFVLLELGQPMHAFDLSKIKGGIKVRMAEPKEKLTLLDGQTLELRDDSLVIADHESALALAGIMGGQDSAVTEQTQDIFLESAFFAPLALAGKARSYGLHTDSSHRFERGVDYQLQEKAIERATELLLAIVGGEAGPLCHAKSETHLPEALLVTLRKSRLNQMLGMAIEDATVEAILKGLGFSVQVQAESWQVEIPSYRFDISIEEDLIEEIARIFGYNQLPAAALDFSQGIQPNSETQIARSRFMHMLASLGYQESICYSFIDQASFQYFDKDAEAIALANPISSELAVMRSSLWPGLIKAAAFNQKRQQYALRLFEQGLVFKKQGSDIEQKAMLAGLVSSQAMPVRWDGSQGPLDFFDVKADLEALLAMTGASIRFEASEHQALHPGQSAAISKDGKHLGYLGALHPQAARDMDISGDIFVFELELSVLQGKTLPKYQGVSRFPGTSRDLALIVDQNLTVQALLDTAYQVKSDIFQGVEVFDLYTGHNIGEGKKSIAISLHFQHPERTLEDLEVTDFVDKMAKKLQQSFNAKLRD